MKTSSLFASQWNVVVVGALPLFSLLAACSDLPQGGGGNPGQPGTETDAMPPPAHADAAVDTGHGADATPVVPPGIVRCGGPLGAPRTQAEISALPTCTAPGIASGAKNRLVPASSVTAAAQPSFYAVSGGYCVPESLLRTGGARDPIVSCSSIVGAGACTPIGVPKLDSNPGFSFLNAGSPAVCSDVEKCAPCTSGGTSTGACDVTKADQPAGCTP